MINITGLWINETKDGKKYFSGNLGTVNVLIFKNEKKEAGSKQPDYNMCIAERKKKDDGKAEEKKSEGPKNDEIPF